MRRHKIGHGKSKRMFSSGAMRVHPKNMLSGGLAVMRGGIRL